MIAKHTQNLVELFELGEAGESRQTGIGLGCHLMQVQEEQGFSDNEINLIADLVLAGNDLDMCVNMLNLGVEDLDVLY